MENVMFSRDQVIKLINAINEAQEDGAVVNDCPPGRSAYEAIIALESAINDCDLKQEEVRVLVEAKQILMDIYYAHQ